MQIEEALLRGRNISQLRSSKQAIRGGEGEQGAVSTCSAIVVEKKVQNIFATVIRSLGV
jgi:hypothetical protein